MTFDDGTVEDGLVYIATEDNAAFLGPAPAADIAQQIARSSGPSGPNRDYLLNLAEALRTLGDEDAHVLEIESHLR
jgi:cation transport protein ChaC